MRPLISDSLLFLPRVTRVFSARPHLVHWPGSLALGAALLFLTGAVACGGPAATVSPTAGAQPTTAPTSTDAPLPTVSVTTAAVPDIAVSVFSVAAAPPPSSVAVSLPSGDLFETSVSIHNRGDADLPWKLALQPQVRWLSATPESGRVAPGDSQSVLLSLDSAGLDPGGYSAVIIIGSDDPDEPEVRVPVDLTVTGGGGYSD